MLIKETVGNQVTFHSVTTLMISICYNYNHYSFPANLRGGKCNSRIHKLLYINEL